MKTIYRFPEGFVTEKYTLGELYIRRDKILKFIKVTKKGFNFLDIKASKCVLGRHLYARKFSGKEIPIDKRTFKVNTPKWFAISLRKYPSEKVS